jgi:hypothetical protein
LSRWSCSFRFSDKNSSVPCLPHVCSISSFFYLIAQVICDGVQMRSITSYLFGPNIFFSILYWPAGFNLLLDISSSTYKTWYATSVSETFYLPVAFVTFYK